MILLGRYGFGCKKYAFHNQVTRKKFARVKLKKRRYLSLLFFQHPPIPPCTFHFLVPFTFLPSSLLVFFLCYLSHFRLYSSTLRYPDPQNCSITFLNMLRCVGNAKEPGDKLFCTRICYYSMRENPQNIFFSRLIQRYLEMFFNHTGKQGMFHSTFPSKGRT